MRARRDKTRGYLKVKHLPLILLRRGKKKKHNRRKGRDSPPSASPQLSMSQRSQRVPALEESEKKRKKREPAERKIPGVCSSRSDAVTRVASNY